MEAMRYHHQMSFYFSTDVGVFMFPDLNINGVGPLIVLCITLLIFALIYEAVKIIQTKNKSRAAREILHQYSRPGSHILADDENQLQLRNKRRKDFFNRSYKICLQTLVFLFQTVLGYLLMLAVMVYNGYVFFAIVFGFALGYFFFGHMAMRINMENIRARKTHVICSPTCPTEPSTYCEEFIIGHQPANQNNNQCEKDGCVSEIASSTSSLSTSVTQTTHLDKEVVDIHITKNFDDDN